ncbi:hypothetical protein IU483_02270 [Streptomyces gardneri]|nr:hypothetical protein [Streptomyces gardneri]
MSAPSPGTSTRFRLARITGLVLGSLVFLHACERSKSALLSDVRVEVAIAAALGAAALAAAWFEIKLRAQEQDDDPPWEEHEPDQTPRRGNFPGRSGRSADRAHGHGEPAGRTRPAARPEPVAHHEDDDQPELTRSAGPADIVAGIARTLRIARPGTEDERPLPPALSAVTKWMRRIDRDDDTEPDEIDDHDEIEQITRTETGELVVESSGRTVRAKISRSGDLVLHGRSHAGRSEWKWTFQPDAFQAIRAALGEGPGDLLDLLEDTIPWLDADARQDPGAWLRAHDIPATYREKGVSATQVTRELPVLRPGRPPQRPRAGMPRRSSPNDSFGTARGSAEVDDHARYPARRTRPPTDTRSLESPPIRRDGRSTHRRAADPRQSSPDADADRWHRGHAAEPATQRNRWSDDYDSPARSRPARRHRDEPEPARPSDRFPPTDANDPDLPVRPAPGRPELPRRRRRELADDDQHDAHRTARQPDRYPGDAEGRRTPTNRRAPTDFEPGPARPDRVDPGYRNRSTPPEPAYDPPPPSRRHRGEPRPRPDTRATSQERTSRHGR